MSSATVRGIASSLGVSPATVSRSLNNSPDVSRSVRARVVAEAQRVGYELPRRAGRTGRIGIIFFNETSGPKFSGYDAVVWGGVTRAAMALKYDVCIIDPLDRKGGESFAAFFARKGVDGLVLRVDGETRHFCAAIAAERIPHVVIADRFDDERVNYVCCNSSAPSRSAIDHLLHLGHRRVAVVHNAVLDTDHRDRIDAYCAALAEAGVEVDPDMIIAINADIGGGAAALNRLMSAPEPPTAIFFTDPALTAGALRRALEVGIRVPEELSVIGVDDERLRKMTHPVFTAVCQNAAELGHQAGRWLCRQLAHPTDRDLQSSSLRLEIEAFLEINQTTAPPPDEPVRVTPTGQRIVCAPNGGKA
ncbi:MAG: LacI family transcriptional regulator [bacterium]|nr:LacI family transcriptional regulator [bacterium]